MLAWLLPAALLLAALLLAVWALGWRPYRHWERRGVPSLRPRLPFLGSSWRVLAGRQSAHELVVELCAHAGACPALGFFQLRQPFLLVRAPDLLRDVTVKRFPHFPDHQRPLTGGDEPVVDRNLVALHGTEWRRMRATLSPAFTGSKLRAMCPLIGACGRQLAEHVRHLHEQGGGDEALQLDAKDLFTRFTNDAIASVAFGVEVDSLRNPDNEFYRAGRAVTSAGATRMWVLVGYLVAPRLMRALGISMLPPAPVRFLRGLVLSAMQERQRRGIVRPDMLQLLMQARAGELKSDPGEEAEDPSGGEVHALTDDDVVAQAIIFFFAGFDTVSTALTFLALSVAEHPEVQERLRAEVDEALRQGGGELSYEAVQGLKYLDMVVSESLRLYSPAAATDRRCASACELQPGDGSGPVRCESGDMLWLPIAGLHRDPQYWPDPERFDPERFSDENKASIQPFTYMPFGLGPRMCIAQRLALLEMKLALCHLLAGWQLRRPPSVPRLDFAPGLRVEPQGGAGLLLEPRA